MLVTSDQAVELLRAGEVVALPTETVYGLAGAIDHPEALKSIFALKHRPSFDPLIVHVLDSGQARSLTMEWPDIYSLLTAKFWPGPLTLIAPKSKDVSPVISAGLQTVAVRSPNHPLFREILKRVGRPLAAPSANLFGHTSPTLARHVEDEFEGRVPVVDGGPCSLGVESTVISAEKSGRRWKISILRPGGITPAMLRSALDGDTVEIVRRESSASPGHTKTHYRPPSPLVLLENKSWSAEIQSAVEREIGRKLSGAVHCELPPTPQEAARTLYENFRRLSSGRDRAIWIQRKPEQQVEDWDAVWDRVERAASVIL